MFHIAAAATAVVLSLSASLAVAQSNPVVIELYTSQGCSSCPPADRLMNDLSTWDDVIALALHVDYWDYIGWKDSFADPAYTERQKAYAHVGQRRMIYTPQFIVNGVHDVVGARTMQLADRIVEYRAAPDLVEVAVDVTDGVAVISATAVDALPNDLYDIQIVQYILLESVKITRGENAGKEIDYINIVRQWEHVADWDGSGAVEVTARVDPSLPHVVLVQARHAEGPGAIVAAAHVN